MSLDETPEEPPEAAAGQPDEAELWAAFRRDRSAMVREKLFLLHAPFARQVARHRSLDRTGGDIEFADLCQLAYAGLLEAIDRFDPDLGAPFRPYAIRRVTGSVLDGIAKTSELREQIAYRRRARSDRTRSLMEGQAADVDDPLQRLAELAVGLALGFMLEGTSLYQTDVTPTGAGNAYESLAWKETVNKVVEAVDHLADRERSIIQHHYLRGLTFDQIGALLGISKGRVSQLHKAALEQLRRRLGRAATFWLEK